MLQVLEFPGLTRAQADERATNEGIDAQTVEIIQQADGTFTVRATFPEGMIIPNATGSIADSNAPFSFNGLTESAADEEVALFRDSGATVAKVPEAGGLFTVQITPAPAPALIEPPQTAAPNAPDLDGYVFCLDRIRTETRPGLGSRVVSRYQSYFNRAPVADIFGMAVERPGPGNNTQAGVDQHLCIEAGVYPLFTHAAQDNIRYHTIGYHEPVNAKIRPWPCVGIEHTGERSGVLIHCASGFLMSTGCINLTSNVADAQTNLFFPDSWSRVVALIDSIKAHLGGAFPASNNQPLPHTSLVIRGF